MNVAKFVEGHLAASWNMLPRVSVAIGTLVAEGVDNGGSSGEQDELGGAIDERNLVLAFKPADFGDDDPAQLLGKIATVGTERMRIVRVRDGKAAVHLEFSSPEQN